MDIQEFASLYKNIDALCDRAVAELDENEKKALRQRMDAECQSVQGKSELLLIRLRALHDIVKNDTQKNVLQERIDQYAPAEQKMHIAFEDAKSQLIKAMIERTVPSKDRERQEAIAQQRETIHKSHSCNRSYYFSIAVGCLFDAVSLGDEDLNYAARKLLQQAAVIMEGEGYQAAMQTVRSIEEDIHSQLNISARHPAVTAKY